jgi:hypothetical protein
MNGQKQNIVKFIEKNNAVDNSDLWHKYKLCFDLCYMWNVDIVYLSLKKVNVLYNVRILPGQCMISPQIRT